MKYFLTAILLLISMGCQQPCPEPTPEPQPPVPPIVEPPPVVEQPKPEPTPEPTPAGPSPKDYLTMERAAHELDRFNGAGLTKLLQAHIWDAVRNPSYTANNCPYAFGEQKLFPWSIHQTLDRAEAEQVLHQQARAMEARLNTINRRCPELQEFCGRSNVRKTALADMKAKLKLGLDWGGEFNQLIPMNTTPACSGVRAYDNVAGWCTFCGKW